MRDGTISSSCSLRWFRKSPARGAGRKILFSETRGRFPVEGRSLFTAAAAEEGAESSASEEDDDDDESPKPAGGAAGAAGRERREARAPKRLRPRPRPRCIADEMQAVREVKLGVERAWRRQRDVRNVVVRWPACSKCVHVCRNRQQGLHFDYGVCSTVLHANSRVRPKRAMCERVIPQDFYHVQVINQPGVINHLNVINILYVSRHVLTVGDCPF